MNILRSGLILKSVRKSQCVDFYRNVLQLPVLFENDFLTCFAMGASYLMIEPLTEIVRSKHVDSQVIRLNVHDPLEEHRRLVAMGIDSSHQVFDWGEIVVLFDPDGNQIELKDESSFAKQILTFSSIV